AILCLLNTGFGMKLNGSPTAPNQHGSLHPAPVACHIDLKFVFILPRTVTQQNSCSEIRESEAKSRVTKSALRAIDQVEATRPPHPLCNAQMVVACDEESLNRTPAARLIVTGRSTCQAFECWWI
ncbi:hypothetical protein Ciccas_013323, partial [Cichlidogyrus casuarinus]